MLFLGVTIITIIIAVVLFNILGSLVKALIGLISLAIIVGLTFMFPYVMIPLIIIGYFYKNKRKETETN